MMNIVYEVLIKMEASSKEIDEITCFLNYSFISEEIKNFFVYLITDFCDHLKTHHIIDDFALLDNKKEVEIDDEKRS